MTLIELTIALGILTVAVGCLVQILSSINVGQKELAGRQAALRMARTVAERIIECDDDWQALCDQYDALPDVRVAVADGDGDSGSGWSQITVRVESPLLAQAGTRDATLVFGKTN